MTTQVTNWELNTEALKTLAQAGIIPRNTPPAQVAVFAEVAKRHGLDPFTKEVHLVGYGGNYSVIVGINGLRGKASDTGLHAGTDAPLFDLQPDGKYHTLATLTAANRLPQTCTVTVYKMMGGQRVPFTATAAHKEFTTNKNKWASMPYQMIMKVAESHALRKAFPRQVSGLYLDEEMQQSAQPKQDETKVKTSKAEEKANDAAVAISELFDTEVSAENLTETDRAKMSKILRANWKTNKTWRTLIVEKHVAKELTIEFLKNYLLEDATAA